MHAVCMCQIYQLPTKEATGEGIRPGPAGESRSPVIAMALSLEPYLFDRRFDYAGELNICLVLEVQQI